MIETTAFPGRSPRPKRRYSFVLTAWLALWTALLCAMPSGAIQSAKMLGSAFDPATTSVALKSRTQTLARQSAPRRTPPSPDIHIPERRAVILALAPLSEAAVLSTASPLAPAGMANLPRGDAQPRAPPIA